VIDDTEDRDIFTWNRSEETLTNHPGRGIFIYFVYLIHLYGALCYGRNASCQEQLLTKSMLLQLGLAESELVQIVTSVKLPLSLRSACLKVWASVHFYSEYGCKCSWGV
jgi:hypothetical protein